MPTNAERTALKFLAAIALTGSLVRLASAARRSERPTAAAASALAVQRRRADSLAAVRAEPRSETRPARRAQPDAPTAEPRPVDIDHASAAEIEALPRIGPSIATRVVKEREAHGPFGSLDALEKRVRGIGPALAKAIAPFVTFSGR